MTTVWRALAALLVISGLWAGNPVSGQSRSPGSLTIAAASDLQLVLPELTARFERDTGITISVSYGSSGTLFAQVQNGAPYDLFFSADVDYPRRLGASRHADAGTLYVYAIGRLVLWTRNDTGIDIRRGMAVLEDARVRRIAIANPAYAPYGRAAVAALRSAKLYDAVRARIVMGENASQTAQLADSGNADVAIIGSAHALSPALRGSGVYWEIPATAHPPIEQAAVAVGSRNRDAARRFLAYVKRPDSQALFQRFGFTVPQPAAH